MTDIEDNKFLKYIYFKILLIWGCWQEQENLVTYIYLTVFCNELNMFVTYLLFQMQIDLEGNQTLSRNRHDNILHSSIFTFLKKSFQTISFLWYGLRTKGTLWSLLWNHHNFTGSVFIDFVVHLTYQLTFIKTQYIFEIINESISP